MSPQSLPNIIVAVDHATAKVFRAGPARAGASAREISHDAPQQFRHHIDRQQQDADRDEKHPEDITFFEQIAGACIDADRIVLIGHGHGQSNAAHHLIAHFSAHHPELADRVLPALTADLSHITDAQLIELGHHALQDAARSSQPTQYIS